jgi:hypothetical protein
MNDAQRAADFPHGLQKSASASDIAQAHAA